MKKLISITLYTVMLFSIIGIFAHGHITLANSQADEQLSEQSQWDGQWVLHPHLLNQGQFARPEPSLTIRGSYIETVEYNTDIGLYFGWPQDWGGFEFGMGGSTQPCHMELADESSLIYRKTTTGIFNVLENDRIEVITSRGSARIHNIQFSHNELHGDVLTIGRVIFIRDVTHPPPEIIDGEFGVATEHGTIISTASELASIRDSAGTYILANDIIIPGNWIPIDNFRGTLDGAGHTITLSARSTTHLATAGLFGGITEGTVIIRNLSVETSGSTGIAAQAPDSGSSQAFAGGLIGTVTGGDVTIENSSFNGNVRATSNFCRFATGLHANPVRYISQFALGGLTDLLAPWAQVVYYLGYYGVYHGLYAELTENGSRSHSGGFIGFIGGDANVRIVNSYTRGSVSANARVSFADAPSLIGTARARSFAGGLVGSRTGSSRLIIENSYVTNNIETFATTPPFRRPDSNSGALVGGGGITAIGTIYRPSIQGLSVDRVFNATTFLYGNINTIGITNSLTHAQMQNRNSFAGWDFDNVWTIDPDRNNGFPHHREFVHVALAPAEPMVNFNDGFTATIGSESPLNLEIDMPISAFVSVMVNDMILTKDVHYTVASGSTIISLLPNFLNTLEDGFHTLIVNFADGVYVQECFLVEETDIPNDVNVTSLYIDDILIFSIDEGGLLIDESLLESLYYEHQSYSIEFSDGRIAAHADGDTIITLADDCTDSEPQEALALMVTGIEIIIIAFVIVMTVFRKRKKPSEATTAPRHRTSTTGQTPITVNTSAPAFCSSCSVELMKTANFCNLCGAAVTSTQKNIGLQFAIDKKQ